MEDNTKDVKFVKWVVDGLHCHNLGISELVVDPSYWHKLGLIVADFDPETTTIPTINKLAKDFETDIDNDKVVLTKHSNRFSKQYKLKQEVSDGRNNTRFVNWIVEGYCNNRIRGVGFDPLDKKEFLVNVKKVGSGIDEISLITKLAEDFEPKIINKNFVLIKSTDRPLEE